MSFTRSALGALVIAIGAGQSAVAQDHGVRIFAKGGGYNALTSVNDAGTSDFKKTGYNLGGGVAVPASRYVTFRGDFDFGRNELRTNSVATGFRTNRFFYDAAVQLQYPTSSGFEPYLFVGGGAVTIHPVGTTGQNKTRATGTFGLGLNYLIPRTNFGVFAEGKSWLYKLENLSGPLAGFSKTQYEVAWTGGISYRFPW